MKKALKWIGIGVCALVVLLAASAAMFGGAMLKGAVNRFGPPLLGVPVTLEKASFRPFAGKLKLTKLYVGNPKEFKTPALFDVDEVDVELNVRSLLSDTIEIHKIIVAAPHATYETSLRGSNIGALTKQLEGGAKSAGEKTAGAKEQKGGKKVIIEKLIVTDAEINVSVTAANGLCIPVKIGKIELDNVGKADGGVTFSDAIAIIIGAITGNIENAVLGAGGLIESGAEVVGDAVVDGASSVIKNLGGLLSADNRTDESEADGKK